MNSAGRTALAATGSKQFAVNSIFHAVKSQETAYETRRNRECESREKREGIRRGLRENRSGEVEGREEKIELGRSEKGKESMRCNDELC